MSKTLCVYSSSCDEIDRSYFTVAEELGCEISQQGFGIVFGGSRAGLMGALAVSVHNHGGKVTGVIPENIFVHGVACDCADELIVTKDLRERKAIMESKADAFLALPGGFGTLEELFEILTLKQLYVHTKPVIILNINGFYDPLCLLFEHIFREHFALEAYRDLYQVVDSVAGIFQALEEYQPMRRINKWSKVETAVAE